MYAHKSGCNSFEMKLRRSLVLKTKWIWVREYEWAIVPPLRGFILTHVKSLRDFAKSLQEFAKSLQGRNNIAHRFSGGNASAREESPGGVTHSAKQLYRPSGAVNHPTPRPTASAVGYDMTSLRDSGQFKNGLCGTIIGGTLVLDKFRDATVSNSVPGFSGVGN
jgi:hypothetical protein